MFKTCHGTTELQKCCINNAYNRLSKYYTKDLMNISLVIGEIIINNDNIYESYDFNLLQFTVLDLSEKHGAK